MRRVFRKYIKNQLLRRIVQGAGSLRQARNELRWLKQELPPSAVAGAARLRARGHPLQYILGSQPFGDLSIKCSPGVLIPRWETEEWVSELASRLGRTKPLKVLDLCTGTGCVLFGLCSSIPQATGFATDISPHAIALFQQNQASLGLEGRTSVLQHSVFEPLPQELRGVQCVVANPPYIRELSEADRSVRQHEPSLALVEPPHLWEALVERVVETAATHAVFEVGCEHQIDVCKCLFASHGWQCSGEQDSAGKWRTVWATRASHSSSPN